VTDIDIADMRYEYYDKAAIGLATCMQELQSVANRLHRMSANAAVVNEPRRSRYHHLLAKQVVALNELLGEFQSSHRASATWAGREVDRLLDAKKQSPMVQVARQPRGIRIDRARQKSVG